MLLRTATVFAIVAAVSARSAVREGVDYHLTTSTYMRAGLCVLRKLSVCVLRKLSVVVWVPLLSSPLPRTRAHALPPTSPRTNDPLKHAHALTRTLRSHHRYRRRKLLLEQVGG